MTKPETAMYLANLLSIMQSKESAGRHRGMTLANEYNRVYDQFVEGLRKEQENEAGKGQPQRSRSPEAGTGFSSR